MYFKFYSMLALSHMVLALKYTEDLAYDQYSAAPSMTTIFASTSADALATTIAAANDGFMGNIGDQGISGADPCRVYDA